MQLAGEQYLTLNAATILGGTDVEYDTVGIKGTAASKLNIIPKVAPSRMATCVSYRRSRRSGRGRRCARSSRSIFRGRTRRSSFSDEYPAMPPTPGNARILAAYDTASEALGYGPVRALDPGSRGAGDMSFVAPLIDGIDGLGALGTGAHAPGGTRQPERPADADRTRRDVARAALEAARCELRPQTRFGVTAMRRLPGFTALLALTSSCTGARMASQPPRRSRRPARRLTRRNSSTAKGGTMSNADIVVVNGKIRASVRPAPVPKGRQRDGPARHDGAARD